MVIVCPFRKFGVWAERTYAPVISSSLVVSALSVKHEVGVGRG